MKARVALSQVEEAFEEIKFKMQAKGIESEDIKSFFFNPFKPQAEVSLGELKQILDRAGVEDSKNLLIARFIVEADLPGDKTVEYSEGNSCSQDRIVQLIQKQVGSYFVYTDSSQQRRIQAELREKLKNCLNSLKEGFEIEENDDGQTVTAKNFRQVFEDLEIEVTEEQMQFMLFTSYKKSQNHLTLLYAALFDMLEDEALAASASEGRKRPESSSPEKLKARNKEKF